VASDVYSLGVILYELLTGRGPYATSGATPAEMVAAVVTQDVPRPSSVARETDKALLRGDLDGIALKALAKRPEDRYGSVEQFSEDLQRHLDGLPVTAVEGTRGYVARKFVLRHRLAVGAAALLLLTLVGDWVQRFGKLRVAERERALAEQRFSDARKLANYLLFPLYDSVAAVTGIAASARRHGRTVAAISGSSGGRQDQRPRTPVGVGRRLRKVGNDSRSASGVWRQPRGYG